jgi:sigma-B regulation protein RsbU (phosphoserine phosphatase)
VTKKLPDYLRLVVDEGIDDPGPELAETPGLARLCRAFEEATGWPLEFTTVALAKSEAAPLWSAELAAEIRPPVGRLEIPRRGDSPGASSSRSRVCIDEARRLADSVAEVVGELHRTRQTVWEREAELAAGIPLVPHRDEAAHLAARLEAVLKGGAEAVDGHAAALYLLDDGTSQLKLRAAWGLPRRRLLDRARPLRGAAADLEALLGRAVVLEDLRLQPHWNAPRFEGFASAACVPVSSPTVPLGTMWVFCRTARDFTPQQTNVLEIVAGRLAADLEREVLLSAGMAAGKERRLLDGAVRLQQGRLPRQRPLVDDWDVGGAVIPKDDLAGGFYDWMVRDDGRLVVTAGCGQGNAVEAALTASAVQTAALSHAPYAASPAELAARVNGTLWRGSAGGESASFACGHLAPERGHVEWAAAGSATVVLLRQKGSEEIVPQGDRELGSHETAPLQTAALKMRSGDVLVAIAGAPRLTQGVDASTVSQRLRPALRAPAGELAERAIAALAGKGVAQESGSPPGAAVLVLARRR